VEYIARYYREHDVRVAILSRGYGTESGPNDEALVLEENLPDVPHLQGPDRVALAQAAMDELETELLVLDDGFQHRRLARDLDIVLIDATAPWGHGYLLPRGLLREPVSSLQRASVILLTRCDQVEPTAKSELARFIHRRAPQVPVVETTHRPLDLCNSEGAVLPLTALKSSQVAAFCGLGNPRAFHRTLTDIGATLSAFRTYPDHHAYTRADVDDLHDWTRSLPQESLIVTTQKDLVKLRLSALGDCSLWSLRIRLHVEAGEDVLMRKLRSVLAPGEEHS
jgi:tetraacyldisaccharide 4'-kinase